MGKKILGFNSSRYKPSPGLNLPWKPGSTSQGLVLSLDDEANNVS